jgi:hypothetical protein
MASFNALHLNANESVGDNAFVTKEVDMPEQRKVGDVPAIVGFSAEGPDLDADGDFITIALTSENKGTSEVNVDDETTLLKYKWDTAVITSGNVKGTSTHHYICPAPIPYLKNKLYIQMGQKSGATVTVRVKVDLVIRNIPGAKQQSGTNVKVQYA